MFRGIRLPFECRVCGHAFHSCTPDPHRYGSLPAHSTITDTPMVFTLEEPTTAEIDLAISAIKEFKSLPDQARGRVFRNVLQHLADPVPNGEWLLIDRSPRCPQCQRRDSAPTAFEGESGCDLPAVTFAGWAGLDKGPRNVILLHVTEAFI